ncbi:DUF2270 domain-containing protein [Candidatus Leptofilum sp.]|uniref:DUF2270 domain-containing protein n=1 Tax=Candidatus Leptofilum sp. TaxID=3241576 RepID=UPI003B5C4A29
MEQSTDKDASGFAYPPPPDDTDLEHVWEFAGQHLDSGNFTNAMIHFYRGEMTRSNVWRQRLDATTNWAVITTGAALTFVFSDPIHTASILLIDSLFVLLFLFIEARRYRYYELWTNRVRLMEKNFFVGLLSPPFMPHADWADKITESLNNPRFPIGLLEALGCRYRRNYAPIFLILAGSWIGKIYMHPVSVDSLEQFVTRSAMGPLPGWLVLTVGFIFNGSLIALGLFTVGLQETQGEVLSSTAPRWRNFLYRLRHITWDTFETELPRLARFDTRKQLAYIISDKMDVVSQVLMKELGRGVTLINATGMYTGKEHGVLMCALESRQKAALKRLVAQTDPDAFVILTPAEDVRGGGFRPLET